MSRSLCRRWPALLAVHSRRGGRRRAERRRRCCAMRSRSPRPASTRRRSPTSIPARVLAHIFEAPLDYDYLAQPARVRAQHRGRAARGVGRLPRFMFRLKPGHLLRRRPGVQGQAARADRAGLRVRDQAPLRPALEERQALPVRERGHPRPERAAPRGDRAQASRSTTTARSRACARSTATRFEVRLARAEPALAPSLFADPALAGAVAREVVEFYGDQHRRASGGHRPVPAGAMAAQLAHRAGAQPGLPRAALRRAPGRRRRQRGRRSPRAARAGACRWSTASRSRSSRSRSRAGWRSSTASRTSSSACPTSSASRRCRTASWRRNLAQARHADGALPAQRHLGVVLQHGGPGGRRLHAGEGRAAARDRAGGGRRRARSAWRATARRFPAQSHIAPPVWGYDPAFKSRDERIRPRQGARAARPVRLRRPRRRRLARAARRHSRW